ncbi:MAG: hypothetical protein ACRDXB_15690, partial [Actinomycetes bacterium]
GWYNGGFLKNLARNVCAAPGSFNVVGYSCQDLAGQHWRHQNGAIVNGRSGDCMEPYSSVEGAWIYIKECRTTTRQGWSVTYW